MAIGGWGKYFSIGDCRPMRPLIDWAGDLGRENRLFDKRAAIGFAIYLFGLGGWEFLLTKRPGHWGNGWLAFLACVGGGAAIGLRSYFKRHEQVNIHLPQEGIYAGEGGAWLFVKRIGVILGAIVAFYFIWQLAKGI